MIMLIFFPRFYYYQGRIKATQLDYSEAHKYLVQSSRKAPQNSANGFKQHVTKLSITVELLLGNIPERQVFLAKDVSEILCSNESCFYTIALVEGSSAPVSAGDPGGQVWRCVQI